MYCIRNAAVDHLKRKVVADGDSSSDGMDLDDLMAPLDLGPPAEDMQEDGDMLMELAAAFGQDAYHAGGSTICTCMQEEEDGGYDADWED